MNSRWSLSNARAAVSLSAARSAGTRSSMLTIGRAPGDCEWPSIGHRISARMSRHLSSFMRLRRRLERERRRPSHQHLSLPSTTHSLQFKIPQLPLNHGSAARRSCHQRFERGWTDPDLELAFSCPCPPCPGDCPSARACVGWKTKVNKTRNTMLKTAILILFKLVSFFTDFRLQKTIA